MLVVVIEMRRKGKGLMRPLVLWLAGFLQAFGSVPGWYNPYRLSLLHKNLPKLIHWNSTYCAHKWSMWTGLGRAAHLGSCGTTMAASGLWPGVIYHHQLMLAVCWDLSWAISYSTPICGLCMWLGFLTTWYLTGIPREQAEVKVFLQQPRKPCSITSACLTLSVEIVKKVHLASRERDTDSTTSWKKHPWYHLIRWVCRWYTRWAPSFENISPKLRGSKQKPFAAVHNSWVDGWPFRSCLGSLSWLCSGESCPLWWWGFSLLGFPQHGSPRGHSMGKGRSCKASWDQPPLVMHRYCLILLVKQDTRRAQV